MSRPYIRQEILEVAVFKMMFMFPNPSSVKFQGIIMKFLFFPQEKFGSFWTVIAANFLNEYQKQCYEVMQRVIFFISHISYLIVYYKSHYKRLYFLFRVVFIFSAISFL